MGKPPGIRGLKPRCYYILLSLSDGDRHGQAIARDVLELSSGQVRLWPAALYGSLDELHQDGWIGRSTRRAAAPPTPATSTASIA